MIEYVQPFASIIVACAAVYGAWNSRKNGKAIEVVRVATDGMKTELVSEVRKAAKAEGRADGIATERADPQVSSKVP